MPRHGVKKPPLRGQAERDSLVLANYKLSRFMVKKMMRLECVKRLGQEDASQAGLLALIRAAEQWDSTRGITFATYACTAIWKAVMSACSDSSPVPCNKAKRRKGIYPPMPFSLPPPRDTLVDKVYLCNDPDQGDLLDLKQAYAHLPERWRRVLHELYYNNMMYREAGKKMGLSHERVRQIRSQAVGWLREYVMGNRPRLPRDIIQRQPEGDVA